MRFHSGYILISLLLICSTVSLAQERIVKAGMKPITYMRGTGRTITVLKELKVWCKGAQPDSVLWAVRYASRGDTSCKDQVATLKVLTKKEGRNLKIAILRHYNPFLSKDVVLSYVSDSLKKWDRRNYPDEAVPPVVLELPYCINSRLTYRPSEIYFFPFNTGIGYPDTCLNEMPLAASVGRSGVVELGSTELYFNKSTYNSPDEKISIMVKQNGKVQEDKIVDQLVYKNRYRLTDTLVIGKELFRIDSIGGDWENVYLRRLSSGTLQAKMPDAYMRQLAPYFKDAEEYLMLDFWGTWCKPCIAAMPELRELHSKVKSRVPFVSICFDNPENYTRAKEIFAENKLEWPQIFSSMKDRQHTIVGELSVTVFPTYMLVKKNGDIFFSSGPTGFKELNEIVLKH